MTRKISRIIGIIMLLVAVIFIVVALNNPQFSFPWSNMVTYSIYAMYFAIMIIALVAPFRKKDK